MISTRPYGWRPQLPDHRDFQLSAPLDVAFPDQLDIRYPWMPAVWDQGQAGSCTAHSMGANGIYTLTKAGVTPFMPSRLALYYKERVLEHTTKYDAGASIRDSAKVLADYGMPPENLWPYDLAKLTKAPPAKLAKTAGLHRALKYEAVPQTLNAMKACLVAGRPISVGFSVYESFESSQVARTGIVPMPARNERQLGGHAVLVCGYTADQRFLVRNSWGASWGQNGYFTIPFAYLLNPSLAGDFWALDVVA